MCDSLAHRGPDDVGFYTAPGVGLAHRRLSIIDLKTGRQPMTNEDRTIWVTFNGEIYNYQDLTRQLEDKGHTFSTTSDTETILHLYEEYGLGFVCHLRGMFAFALWDAQRRRLVLARDRIGEKPLYYRRDGNALFFASEIKALLMRSGTRRVHAQAVCDFLATGYVPAPRTFYQGIQKLPPAHLLVYEASHVSVKPYWRRGQNGYRSLSFSTAQAQLSNMLSETVKLCLKSDVEVGAFLSGGVDSSTIVALMHRHSARVQTFTVGYGGEATGFNELHHARRVSDALGTTHHELILDAHTSMELLPRILWHFDEPHGEPTSVLVYLLCEFTKQHRIKVALGGTGGDEIFFGYPRFAGIRVLQYYQMLPRFVRQRLVERFVLKWPESTKGSGFARRAKQFVTSSDLPPENAYLNWVSLLHKDVRAVLLSESLVTEAEDPTGEAVLREFLCGDENRPLLDRAADLDVNAYLPEYQLCYMDRMSMAHGLEVRSPLCDYELVDFVTSLPSSYRLRGLRSKHIFKSIARQWIPRSIAERQKRGFDSPIGHWIKTDLRDFVLQFLSRDNIERTGLLNYQGVASVLNEHLSGRRDYSLQIWSLLALEGWYRMYIEDRVTDGTSYRLEDMRGGTPVGATRLLVPSQPSDNARSDDRDKEQPLWKPSRSLLNATRRELWDATPRTVRKMMSPLLNAFPPSIFLGHQFRNQFSFVQEAEHWDSERARLYQLNQLKKICTLAYERTVFYRRLFNQVGFNPRDLKSLDDFSGLPMITQDTLRTHLIEMLSVPPNSARARFVSTGGTGGKPLYFYMPAKRSYIEYAYLVASWERVGYHLGMPMAVLRGRIVKPNRSGLYHEYDPLLRHHYYSNFHMNDDNMRRYIEHIAGIGPCFLHAYPSSASTLAFFIRRNKLEPPKNIRGVILESENVYPEQEELIGQVFNTRVFSCYGHSEKLVLAVGCEHSNDYHVWPTYGYFELIDDDGRPITTPGKRGEIVGTGFINDVVPFIRYRTGDYATYVGNRCEACGREHIIIRDIRGHRTQEVLITATGSEISWTALNMHDDTFDHVQQFQFRQDTPGRAILRIVPADGFDDSDRRRIIKNLSRKLDGQIELEIELTDSIQLSPRGKAIFVDQRIERNPITHRTGG